MCICLFLAVLGLCCVTGFSLDVVSEAYSLVAEHELLIAVASSVWSTGSVVVAHEPGSPVACGMFPDKG